MDAKRLGQYSRRWGVFIAIAGALALGACSAYAMGPQLASDAAEESGWAGVAQPPGTLKVDPEVVGIHTPVTVSGTGFAAGTHVRFHLGPPNSEATSQAYAETDADSAGFARVRFTMPDHWPEGPPITERRLVVVAADSNDHVRARGSFRYEPAAQAQPALFLRPGYGVPGSQVEAVGHGFTPGALYSLRLSRPLPGSLQFSLTTVTADAQGAFVALFRIPVSWPGTNAPILEQRLSIVLVEMQQEGILASSDFYNQIAPRSNDQ